MLVSKQEQSCIVFLRNTFGRSPFAASPCKCLNANACLPTPNILLFYARFYSLTVAILWFHHFQSELLYDPEVSAFVLRELTKTNSYCLNGNKALALEVGESILL